jgi:energy-coupling factor transporter ATP-binding protein EcfA2
MRSSSSKSFPKLRVTGLGLRYPESDRQVFSGLHFCVSSGEICSISGGNSSGKSSLIHCLCGVIPKSIPAEISGGISWGDTHLSEIPQAEVFRFMSVALAEAKEQMLMPTVELEIAFALENMGLESSEIAKRVEASAARFGLGHLLQASSQKLSGGEQRLLLFAICDSMQNPVLLLDEPETGLSGASLDMLCDWLQEQRQQGNAVILASHNPRLIQMADQHIYLDQQSV